MTVDLIRPLADPGPLAACGGKAFNLGRMLRAGLAVPDGVVVTTMAYRSFVDAHGLAAPLDRAWAALAAGADVEPLSADVRGLFDRVLPPRLADVLRARLPAGPLAVRSSATAEDLPEASFAGQQDTWLHVEGEDRVLDAVRRCWASLWTARAMTYRLRQGLAPTDVALAVVLQRMVAATAAGVMFTAHPVTGDRDHVVVNATWGLGEALVSGRVNPDSIVASRRDGRVLRVEVGEKAVMTAPVATGTADVAVDEARRSARVLDDAQVAALVALGRRLDEVFGCPQDVEWALADGVPVPLQSRAITTGVPGDDQWPPTGRGDPQPFDFWTQQDMGERWPDPVTPLTWSISEPMNQDVIERMLHGLRAPYAGKIAWSRRAWGRVWFNEGALLHVYTQDFGVPLAMLGSGLTHPGATPPGPHGWKLGKVFANLGFFWRLGTQPEKDLPKLEAAFPVIDGWIEAFLRRPLDTEPDAELVREARDVWWGRLLAHVAWHASATTLSMSAYTALEDFLRARAGDASLVQVLAGGVTGVIASEMVPELTAMATALREAGLDGVVLDAPAGDALARLRADPGAARFCTLFDTFLQRHGHRCVPEAELRVPRWVEAPEVVVEQVAATLRTPAVAAVDGATKLRETTMVELERRLGWVARRMLRTYVERLHRFTRMRDNGQGYIVKLLLPVRRLHAELGRRWAARGWLRDADDVWFLVSEDLDAALARPGEVPLQARADARRRAWTYWMETPAPEALDAAGLVVPPSADGDELVGIGAARGVVTGIARVLASPADAGRLQPGDILVTRATDPGWTPVFSTIGGAVLEIGGMLSHGAIVAREYGLPAVVNVPRATTRIADGERITVDGSTGRVTRAG